MVGASMALRAEMLNLMLPGMYESVSRLHRSLKEALNCARSTAEPYGLNKELLMVLNETKRVISELKMMGYDFIRPPLEIKFYFKRFVSA